MSRGDSPGASGSRRDSTRKGQVASAAFFSGAGRSMASPVKGLVSVYSACPRTLPSVRR